SRRPRQRRSVCPPPRPRRRAPALQRPRDRRPGLPPWPAPSPADRLAGLNSPHAWSGCDRCCAASSPLLSLEQNPVNASGPILPHAAPPVQTALHSSPLAPTPLPPVAATPLDLPGRLPLQYRRFGEAASQ